MLEEQSYKEFAKGLQKKIKGLRLMSAQIELTYCCNLACIHCYSLGTDSAKELDGHQWKRLLDQLYAAGVLTLTITGGEPLLHPDFCEVYLYAKGKGFLVTVFTNGLLIDDELITLFQKNPPYAIEITLNGITKEVYEKISGVEGTFSKVISIIDKLIQADLSLVLKTIGLKENKDQIYDIKAFVEKCLGKGKFKFDTFVVPKLNGDRSPCAHRLDPEEIDVIKSVDPDMAREHEEGCEKHQSLTREMQYKYHCNSWFQQCFITPSGSLRFCHLTDKYSVDLLTTPLEQGFYEGFPAILEEKFQTQSKCTKCSLREYCYYCPARAFLETGDDEAPVEYYCALAKKQKEKIDQLRSKDKGSYGD